jgi:signal transduction histidine kinase/sensor domain CHASE-containing protein
VGAAGGLFKLINRFKDFVASKAFNLLAILVLGSVAGIGYSIIKLDRDNHLSTVKRDVEQGLYAATEQIQLRFFEAILVGKNIENILTNSGGIVETQIARVVSEFQRHNPAVIAVALAPGLEVTHSFPQTDNRKSIGMKYWQVPGQMASVAQAYRSQSAVVDGPVSLVQGGVGYILRYPVFLPSADLNFTQFWGIISIVFKADSLLNADRHDFGDEEKYVFSLNELHSSGISGTSAATKDVAPRFQAVITEFSMLDSKWQATARPVGGWPTYSPESRYLVGFALFSALVLLVVLRAYRRLAIKKENAHALLAEAVGCINEGFIAFDDKERLMIVNQKYLDYHVEIADRIVPGVTMRELLRLGVPKQVDSSNYKERNAWIESRLKAFRNPGESFLQYIGSDRWLKVTESKTPHGYTVGIWTDVTAEKCAQEAAEAADREKTDFLNNVSHELRTPLTVIFGRATFLRNSDKLPQSKRLSNAITAKDTPHEELTSAVTNYQNFVSDQGAGIADSAQHMIRLVEDLLDWTKVARGKLELDKSLIQLDELSSSVIKDLQPNANAKGLELTYSGDPTAETMADKVRLKQILYNLINNAIKFTDAGSIHLSMEKEGDQIVFGVTDTGHGISEENQERVFQRFQQVDGSMSRQSGGLGLGLAISEQLAALHGGTLSLISTLGQGSTFSLRLPNTETTISLEKVA